MKNSRVTSSCRFWCSRWKKRPDRRTDLRVARREAQPRVMRRREMLRRVRREMRCRELQRQVRREMRRREMRRAGDARRRVRRAGRVASRRRRIPRTVARCVAAGTESCELTATLGGRWRSVARAATGWAATSAHPGVRSACGDMTWDDIPVTVAAATRTSWPPTRNVVPSVARS